MESLITKYRPSSFDEMLGHEYELKAIKANFASNSPHHTIILMGGAGLGKTTIARLIAAYLGCTPSGGGCQEIDGGRVGGVAAMREITAEMRNRSFEKEAKGVKVKIIDEVHALSTEAWDALLKSTEEPPDHGYWILMSTEDLKIPDTIKSRALVFRLKPVSTSLIAGYLESVIAPLEGVSLPAGAYQLIANEAHGSPRQALSYLGTCRAAESLDEIKQLVVKTDLEELGSLGDFMRLIMKKSKNYEEYKKVFAGIGEISPGGIKPMMTRYLAKVMSGNTGDQFFALGSIMDAVDQFPRFPVDSMDAQFHLGMLVQRVWRS